MDLVGNHFSMKPDMLFGWRPEDITGAPIPMHFDFELTEIMKHPQT